MRDSIHNQTYVPMIPPVVVSDNTAQVSPWLATGGFEALTFGVLTGALADADATFSVLIEDADASDYSDASAVSDDCLLSQTAGVAPEAAAGFNFANDNVARKIGYIGYKKFVRITVTPVSNSSGAAIAVFADCSRPHQQPV